MTVNFLARLNMPAATIPGDAESGKANPGFEGTMMVMARIRPFNESEQHCERALTAGDKQSVSIVHENYPEKELGLGLNCLSANP